ncbi:hypothetical protein 13VV501A_gene0063 [Vibrio phage 13VV501A]|nr:hypothetical protein 13VV501A_gene0063 [Vibrio phage 13VV501A]
MSEAVKYQPFEARWVMGSPFDVQTKDHENKPLEADKYHYFFGVAVPKGPTWDAIWSTMYNAAANNPACTAALCNQQGFNWKVEDCDAPSNPQNKGKDSYPAGHMLLKFKRMVSIGQCPIVDGRGMPVTKDQVKCGDYFYIAGGTSFNGKKTVNNNAGMYQNIDGIMFSRQGDKIVSEGGFNAAAVFAGLQGGVAPSAAAPTGGAMPSAQQPAMAAPAQMQAPVQQPAMTAPAAMQAPVQQPAASLAQPAASLASPAPSLSQPAAAPQRVYEHTDTQFTKEQWVASNPSITDEQLVAAGKGRWVEQPVIQPAHDFLQQPGLTQA